MRKLRLVVTGQYGQVARSLAEVAPLTNFDVIALGRPQMDLGEPSTIDHAIRAVKPDVIVNAAAYTAVDLAESEPGIAAAINDIGAGEVAKTARSLGVPVVHLSTDFVFDGDLKRPYLERDPPRPLGQYGLTKLAGENKVASATPNHAVLRTSWVYSPFGKNFVRTMLTLARDRNEISVVDDQLGSPTSAHDIANGIFSVASNLVNRPEDITLRGLFHMTGDGEATWASFASKIFSLSKDLGGPYARVNRIASSGYPTPARRPANSRLNNEKIVRIHGIKLPHWEQSLVTCIKRLVPEEFSV